MNETTPDRPDARIAEIPLALRLERHARDVASPGGTNAGELCRDLRLAAEQVAKLAQVEGERTALRALHAEVAEHRANLLQEVGEARAALTRVRDVVTVLKEGSDGPDVGSRQNYNGAKAMADWTVKRLEAALQAGEGS